MAAAGAVGELDLVVATLEAADDIVARAIGVA